jgi:PIN domain nuclease of toxin-antitoxin system
LSRWLADAGALIDVYTFDPALPSGICALLENDPATVAVGSTTIWEIAIKTAPRRLPDIRTGGYATLAAMLEVHGFDLLPLDPATAEQAAGLPSLHAVPFDRALVAMALRSGRTVLTSGGMIGRYGVPVSWR